jgi:hypothetical protein
MVGKWVGTKTTSHVLVITQQGAKFVIDEDLESSNGEKLPHHEFVASYQTGTSFLNTRSAHCQCRSPISKISTS